MGASNPGCNGGRCCHSVIDDEAICFWYSLQSFFLYDSDMDPPNHPECWSGIGRNLSLPIDQPPGCRTCDVGCHAPLEDSESVLAMSAMYVTGRSYLRATSPTERWARNAKNQLFDLLSNTPTLIQRKCRVEHGSCADNNPIGAPHGHVCWGHHVCQCMPGPSTAIGDCLSSGPDGGYPAHGLRPDNFFLNFQGWAVGTYGTNEGNELFCRQFHPAVDNDSPRNAAIMIHQHRKNAVFLRDAGGLGSDKLARCAGYVASTSCKDSYGDDCGTPGVQRVPGVAIAAQAGYFDEAYIDHENADLKLRAKPSDTPAIVREKQLYADVIAWFLGQPLPIMENPWTLTLDRMTMPLPSNTYVGNYVRQWDATSFPTASLLPDIMEFQHSYSRWGRVYPIKARMVAIKAKMELSLSVHQFAQTQILPTVDTTWISPYAYVTIDLETAMIIEPVRTVVSIYREYVSANQPDWLASTGFDGIPTITPNGNRIVYARELDGNGQPLPVRVPRKWRWVGRLGGFSDPVTETIDYIVNGCLDLVDDLGTFNVPGLATANEDRPTDPNQNYDGVLPLYFPTTS